MLKVKVEDGFQKIVASGSTAEIGAELLVVIEGIYKSLDKENGKDFKMNMLKLLPACFLETAEQKEKFLNNIKCLENEAEVDTLVSELEDFKKTLEDL